MCPYIKTGEGLCALPKTGGYKCKSEERRAKRIGARLWRIDCRGDYQSPASSSSDTVLARTVPLFVSFADISSMGRLFGRQVAAPTMAGKVLLWR